MNCGLEPLKYRDRLKTAVILTILKLDLNLQILSEQVHHHRLHVPSDATAIPFGNKTVSLTSRAKKKKSNRLQQELKSGKVTVGSRSDSLLHQLHDALRVHEEDFPLRLLVERSSVAVQDVCNLKNNKSID